MVVSTCYEISSVKMIDIENLIVVLIKSLHETFLGNIPLLKCQIFTDTAKDIRIYSEFNSINSTFVAF